MAEKKCTYFECVYGDTDENGNDFYDIDGYPDGEDATGTVVAVVYYTPHKDFVVHFNDRLYADVPAVKELIEQAKDDLIAERNLDRQKCDIER